MGDRESFDYNLSAFLSAAMSVRGGFRYRQDRARNTAIKQWCAQWENTLTPEEKSLYVFMREDRVAEVHHGGSNRTVGHEDITLGIGEHRLPGGLFTVFGPPGMPPAVVHKPTFYFTIDGVNYKATEACAVYFALLQRMVAAFTAATP
jgi:hypothetical protein